MDIFYLNGLFHWYELFAESYFRLWFFFCATMFEVAERRIGTSQYFPPPVVRAVYFLQLKTVQT